MSARLHYFYAQGTVSLLGIVLTTGSLSYESDVGRHVFDSHEEKKNHRNRLIRTAYGVFSNRNVQTETDKTHKHWHDFHDGKQLFNTRKILTFILIISFVELCTLPG